MDTHVVRCVSMKSKVSADDSVFFFVYVDYYCHLPPFPVLSSVIFGECVA